ncbi:MULTISPECIES: hypothetical protein [unclassified Ensifer]|uniref:hypothetical protein n=1 Tax=unclassified Ensifer TaxID=2633371 RepID=UPI000813B2AF|nr:MULTISPECIES: hypothetical protein [unclassified Ensifer]OCP21981.1 hypothetical protein BC361_25780 [Ensifer sp. LC54]OCP23239.1 hypothetical protein BC363_24985 [Ensifer sp. LC384]
MIETKSFANAQPILNADGSIAGIRHQDPIYGKLPAEPVVLPEPTVTNGQPVRGRYMHTSNGKKYYPMDPRPSEVHSEVIAHHLANRCRYNGATQHKIYRSKIFYSVAEHSILVSRYIEEVLGKPEYALEGLLHDGSEAYNGDLIRPLKYDPLFRAPFQVVEEKNEWAGALRFNLVYPYPKEVKIADEAVTAAEIEQMIIKDPNEDWTNGKPHDDSRVAPYEIQMLDPYPAKEAFLMRLEELLRKRSKYAFIPSF